MRDPSTKKQRDAFVAGFKAALAEIVGAGSAMNGQRRLDGLIRWPEQEAAEALERYGSDPDVIAI